MPAAAAALVIGRRGEPRRAQPTSARSASRLPRRPTTTAGTSRASTAPRPRPRPSAPSSTSADGIGYDNPSRSCSGSPSSGEPVHHRPGQRLQHLASAVAAAVQRPDARLRPPQGPDQERHGRDIETASQHGAYLAGVLAAKKTKTGTLGIVTSADDTNWYKQSGGFVAGARSVNPDIKFRLAQIGQAGVRRRGRRQARDARPASSPAAPTSSSAWATARPSGCSRPSRRPRRRSGQEGLVHRRDRRQDAKIDKKGDLLSSVLWNFAPVFEEAIADLRRRHVRHRRLRPDGSTTASRCSRPRHPPAAAWARSTPSAPRIVSGKIKVPLTPTRRPGQAHEPVAEPSDTEPGRHPGRARPAPSRNGRRRTDHPQEPAAGTDAPAVELIGITKAFPGVVANDHISLAVRRGEVLCLLGENGAGKSTLMSILSGMISPDEGSIRVERPRGAHRLPRARARAGHRHGLPAPTLIPTLSVAREPDARRARRPAPRRRRARAGGWPSSPARSASRSTRTPRPGSLSLGQQQQIEIIKALWRGSEVLILDEPTSMLTPAGRRRAGQRCWCASRARGWPSSSSPTSCTRPRPSGDRISDPQGRAGGGRAGPVRPGRADAPTSSRP